MSEQQHVITVNMRPEDGLRKAAEYVERLARGGAVDLDLLGQMAAVFGFAAYAAAQYRDKMMAVMAEEYGVQAEEGTGQLGCEVDIRRPLADGDLPL